MKSGGDWLIINSLLVIGDGQEYVWEREGEVLRHNFIYLDNFAGVKWGG